MLIREEREGDEAAIRAVLLAAFATTEEADLVEALRAEGAVLLSLVAEEAGALTGHLLLSRMWVQGGAVRWAAAALAPVAVKPEWQRRGVGSALIREALQRLGERGEKLVIVVGDPAYYGGLGFTARAAARLRSPFPPEYFQALELTPRALEGIEGPVEYAKSFGL